MLENPGFGSSGRVLVSDPNVLEMTQFSEIDQILKNVLHEPAIQIEVIMTKTRICLMEIYKVRARPRDAAELSVRQILERRCQNLRVHRQNVRVPLIPLLQFADDFAAGFITIFIIHFTQNEVICSLDLPSFYSVSR